MVVLFFCLLEEGSTVLTFGANFEIEVFFWIFMDHLIMRGRHNFTKLTSKEVHSHITVISQTTQMNPLLDTGGLRTHLVAYNFLGSCS